MIKQAAKSAFALMLAAPGLGAADHPTLSLPIDCSLGQTCYIQQFVDNDSSPNAQDFRCSGLTYDGHKGTDFALNTVSDLRNSVDVLASAPGIVVGARDGMVDQLMTEENRDTVRGRECGNGVAIDHGNGWTTQYCHLMQGSVSVKEGDTVERGQTIGHVGLSGSTQFPHVHLSVRKDGETVDPFNAAESETCSSEDLQSLWDTTPEYIPGGLIYVGISDGVPQYSDVKAGTVKTPDGVNAPGLVVFAYMFGSRVGDRLHLQIKGPERTLVDETVELTKQQAQLFRAVGKRLTQESWPKGTYTGKVTLVRDSRRIDTKDIQISLN